MSLADPREIARIAEEIYRQKYKEHFEKAHSGKFVVIDIRSKEAHIGDFAEEAFEIARKKAPHGVFHLIRIGAPGAFRVGYAGQQEDIWDWTL